MTEIDEHRIKASSRKGAEKNVYQLKVPPNIIRQCIQGYYIILKVRSALHSNSLMNAEGPKKRDCKISPLYKQPTIRLPV